MTTYQHKFDFGDLSDAEQAPDKAEIEGILAKVQPDTGESDRIKDRIRQLVEATEIAAPEPAETRATKTPAMDVPRRSAGDDRWADLRVDPPSEAPSEPEEAEVDAEPVQVSEDLGDTDLEDFHIPADETAAPEVTNAETAPPPVEPNVAPYETIAGDAPETPMPQAAEAALETAEPARSRTDWGSPSDHEMGRKGKMAWRIGIYGTLLAVPVAAFGLSPFSPKETVQHHVSAMGCQFAALFDWKNIKEGEPGFHAHLDPDGDGVACEVARKRLTLGGGGGFKRP